MQNETGCEHQRADRKQSMQSCARHTSLSLGAGGKYAGVGATLCALLGLLLLFLLLPQICGLQNGLLDQSLKVKL